MHRRELSDWEFQSPSGDWLTAAVPGHIHVDLIRHGLIEDPFVRDNESRCQWVDERNWSYRCRFEWTPDPGAPRRLLRFEGLDTVCSVFLNGERLSDHDNMFVPLDLDVSTLLVQGLNEIRVEFLSATRVGRQRKADYLAEQGLAEDTPNLDERAFVRKAQYMFGWDWGPRLVSCGIWKPITLLEFDVQVDPVYPRCRVLEDGRGRVEIESVPEVVSQPVWHQIQGPAGSYENGFWDDAGFFIQDPRPWDLDRCPRYEVVSTRFEHYDEAVVLDEQRTWFGLSDVQLVQAPDGDGASFEFRLNGRPIYALGANWIPDHSFPSQVSREQVRARLRRAKDLGVNMLRVWGGGIYEDDAFYEACDELGILVWQDFMFACSYYPDTQKWQDAIRAEAEYQVRRLRRHPCIALWCGNNECHQVWQDGWGGKDKQPARFHGEAIYHEVLAGVVARLDPGRAYLPGSPYGEGYCNSGASGDQHYWDVWHGRGDWTHYRDSDARFCSEFGFASSPSKATWKRAGVDVSTGVEDPQARAHNKTGKPFETIRGLVELHYPKAKDLEEWSYFSQLNQRDAMRAALEHFRFGERCRGALVWQLNDCWPVESWSILEFGGRRKAVGHELPRLFAPLLLRIVEVEGGIVLAGCLHNALEPVSGEASLRCFDLESGEELSSAVETATVSLEHSASLVTGPILTGHKCLWVGEFAGARVRVVDAPPVGIDRSPDVTWEPAPGGLRLTANRPVVDLYVEDAADPSLEFEPNFITLLPGETVDVSVGGTGFHPVFRCLGF